jgi:chemotaxis protein histidine kinase CheA
MTTPRLLDFFALEAGEYLSRLESAVRRPGAGGRPDFREMEAAARGLRGSATMARARAIAEVAGRLETVAGRLARGELRPAAPVQGVVQSTMETLAALIRSARNWSRADDDRARAALAELAPYAPGAPLESADTIVPISELFYAGAGPHVLEVAATARTTFEQRLRERQGPSARAPATAAGAPPAARTQSSGLRGAALADLLGSSLATMRSLENAADAPAAGAIVPIQALLYRGNRAVSRAAELRAQFQDASAPPSRELFAELCDLVELAATE